MRFNNRVKPHRSILFIAVFVLFTTVNLTAQNDTIFFTSDWTRTVKDSASFFRLPFKKVGELFRMHDFYISGQPQMIGLSTSAEKEDWLGKVIWYNEDGSIFQEGNYTKNGLDGDFITFMGEEKLVAKYEDDYMVSGKKNVISFNRQKYYEQQGDSIYEIIYASDLNGIREAHYSTKERHRYHSKYYGEKGVLIGEGQLSSGYTIKGIQVFYYASPMRVREINYYPFGELLTSATYYANSQIAEEVKQEPNWSKTFYAMDGKVLAEVTYQLDENKLRGQNGVELFFDYNSKGELTDTVKRTKTYKNGKVISDVSRHKNGQINRSITFENDSKALQVNFDKNGNEIARLLYQTDGYELEPQDGIELFFTYNVESKTRDLVEKARTYENGQLITEEWRYHNGQVKTETSFQNDLKVLQVSYDEKGKETARITFKDDLPFEGTELQSWRSATYKSGELIEEIAYYSNSKIPRVKKSDVLETFYNTKGKVLGELILKDIQGYFEPFEGKRFSVGDADGRISKIEEFKKGKLTRETFFGTRQVAKNTMKTFKTVKLYDAEGKTKETKFYSNGKKQSEINYKGYTQLTGVFYNMKGRRMGSYDYEKEDGIEYRFFTNSDYVQEMKEKKEAEMLRWKIYEYYGSGKYQEIQPVLKHEIDNDCCERHYDEKGNVIATLTYKNQVPWEGVVYVDYERTTHEVKEGKLNGTYQKRSYDDELIEIGQYIENEKEGTFTYYYSDGKLKKTEVYAKDIRNGKTFFYDEKEAQIAELLYENGMPINGVEVLINYHSDSNDSKTYVDGKIVEKVTYDENGKYVTKIDANNTPFTTAYYKNSDKKRLSYSYVDGAFEGILIRYDADGKEQHRAFFAKGQLESGTIYLKPNYQDRTVLYVVLTREADTFEMKYVDHENKVVFKVEEMLAPDAEIVHLKHIGATINNIDVTQLY